jgi:hypothetical protein
MTFGCFLRTTSGSSSSSRGTKKNPGEVISFPRSIAKTKSKSEIRIPACHAFELVFLLGAGGTIIFSGIAVDLVRGIAGRPKLETNSNSK